MSKRSDLGFICTIAQLIKFTQNRNQDKNSQLSNLAINFKHRQKKPLNFDVMPVIVRGMKCYNTARTRLMLLYVSVILIMSLCETGIFFTRN